MIVRQYTFVDMMVIIIYFFKTIRLLRTTGSVEREEEKNRRRSIALEMCGRNDYRNKAYLHKEQEKKRAIKWNGLRIHNVLHKD